MQVSPQSKDLSVLQSVENPLIVRMKLENKNAEKHLELELKLIPERINPSTKFLGVTIASRKFTGANIRTFRYFAKICDAKAFDRFPVDRVDKANMGHFYFLLLSHNQMPSIVYGFQQHQPAERGNCTNKKICSRLTCTPKIRP